MLKAKYAPSLRYLVLFSMFSLTLIYGYDNLVLNANAETAIKNCYGCVNNTSTQVLTIFNFQTNDNPLLAGNSTFLITPNPYAHTTNATDYLDLTTWFNFVVSDNDELDKDPTNGIIELIDVNNGTYSIMQIRGSPGFGLASPEASDEILGTTGFAYTTQTFLNFTSNNIGTVEPPNINTEQLYKIAITGGGKINGMTISNSNDLPPAKLIPASQMISALPPDSITFTQKFASNVTPSTLIEQLGIPTYSPSFATADEHGAFMPPVFVADFTSGTGKIMTTPVMDVVSIGSQIMIRGDNVQQDGFSRFKGIELPMNTAGTNVAMSVSTDITIPVGKPPLPSGFVGLYMDVQSSGDIDFSDSTVYDPTNKPTITFTLPKVGSQCPANVVLNLEHGGEWHPVASNISPASTDADGCTYSVDVNHFSSYLVSTGSDTTGHGHSSSGHGGHGGHSAGAIGHDHTSSDCTINGLIMQVHKKQVYLQIQTNSDGDTTTNTGPGDFYTPGEIRGQLNNVNGKIFTALAKPSNEILTSPSDKILWGKSKATATASFKAINQNEMQYTISGKNISNIVGISLYLGDQNTNSDFSLVDIISSTNPIELNSNGVKGTFTNEDMCVNSHFEDGIVSHDEHITDEQDNEDIISHEEHMIDTIPQLQNPDEKYYEAEYPGDTSELVQESEQESILEMKQEPIPELIAEPIPEPICGQGTELVDGICQVIKTKTSESKGGGCLIATATYGSELAPQVQQLRELRDNSLLQTASGTSFMNSFNQFYYSFSPTIADWERESPIFKEVVKLTLTPMISSLSILKYVDMDSEVSVLGYGISLILLNVGMYFVAPAVIVYTIRKRSQV